MGSSRCAELPACPIWQAGFSSTARSPATTSSRPRVGGPLGRCPRWRIEWRSQVRQHERQEKADSCRHGVEWSTAFERLGHQGVGERRHTAPPAKDNANANVPGLIVSATTRPTTTAMVRTTAASAHMPITNCRERRPDRIATAPTRLSEKFDTRIATSRATTPETPRRYRRATPPTPSSPGRRPASPRQATRRRHRRAHENAGRRPSTTCLAGRLRHLRLPPKSVPVPGRCRESPAPAATRLSTTVLTVTKTAAPVNRPTADGPRPPTSTASGNSSKASAAIRVPLANASKTPVTSEGASHTEPATPPSTNALDPIKPTTNACSTPRSSQSSRRLPGEDRRSNHP